MEKYEKFTLNKTAQEKLKKHNLKHIFDEEKQRYSIISTKANKDGEIDHIFNYDNNDIRYVEYMTHALTDHIDNFIVSTKIINNLENNDNYKDYNIGLKADFDDFQVQLKNKQCLMVVEPKSVVDENVGLTIRTYAGMSKDLDANDIFSDIKDSSEFSDYNRVETYDDLPIEDYPNYYHKTNVTTYLKANGEQKVHLKDEAYCKHKIKFSDLEKTDFLAKPLELFNEKSIVKKYDDIMENPKEHDIVNMLIDEKVIDSKRYNELRKEKKLDDQNVMMNLFNEIDIIAGESMKTAEKEIARKNEQDFIKAVNSVNNKEQDQGLER